MATNFQSAVTFVQMKFFSKFLLHFACVDNGRNIVEEVFFILAQDGATCPRG
jgi:hypothetical protein